MDNTKDDAYFIQKIKKDILFVVTHMRDVDAELLEMIEDE